MSTKRKRAIRAMADKLDLRYATFGFGDALDAAMAIMAEPEPVAEGMVRVRVCVAVDEHGGALWRGNTHNLDHIQRKTLLEEMEPLPVQFHWIEADVPAYEPPAETTVKGRVCE